jgi:hypothetical protein
VDRRAIVLAELFEVVNAGSGIPGSRTEIVLAGRADRLTRLRRGIRRDMRVRVGHDGCGEGWRGW